MEKPREIKPQLLALAPTIDAVPEIHPPAPLELPQPAPSPKPEVKTGIFAETDLAKGPHTPNTEVKVGGFGDPRGAPAQKAEPAKITMAKLGAFDLPDAAGRNGASGKGQTGALKQTAFGTIGTDSSSSPSSASQRNVRTGGFGEAATILPGTTEHAGAPKSLTTPVEILFKPKPVYTGEARKLKLEGQVSLDVIFLASGAVQVVKVTHGLGHGLDEAAQAAALQVRFRPAMRAGVPVDTAATINITFELT